MQFASAHTLFTRHKFQSFLILFISLFIVACGGGSGDDTSAPVSTAALQSITVTPTSASTAAGLTQQFSATGNYTDGSSQVLSTATWSSSNPAVASVNASGLVKSLTAGTTRVTATFGTISASATLTVTSAVLQSIAVSPPSASTAAGLTQQLTATGIYSDGTTQTILTPTWTSSNTTVATINAAGLVSAVSTGPSVITATLGGISGSSTVTVTAATLQSISVDVDYVADLFGPVANSLGVGLTQQFVATGHYSDGSSQVISAPTWSAANTAIATVSASGLVHAVAVGATTISATVNGVSGSTTLTVSSLALQSITFSTSPFASGIGVGSTLSNLSLTVGFSNPIYSIGHYSDGSASLLTNATWTSSNMTAATVVGNTSHVIGAPSSSPSGSGIVIHLNATVTGLAAGNATITASFQGISASIPATVSAATLTSISAINMGGSFIPGSTTTVYLNGNYVNGNSYGISNNVSWSTSDPTIATIDATGNLTFLTAGTVTVTARYAGFTSTVSVTANPAPVVTLSCNAAAPTTISAAAWNAALATSPSDGNNWLILDPVSCANDLNSGVALKNAAGIDSLFYEGPTSSGWWLANPSVSIGITTNLSQLTAGQSLALNVGNVLRYTITVQP